MNLETIKTVALTLLVLVSILLTFGLWNYTPEYDRSSDDYVNEVDLGGVEVTKRDVVQPDQIIFHKDKAYYGFANIKEQQNLYKDMQDWSLHDFQMSHAVYNPKKTDQIEITFPTPIPMEMIQTLFTFHEEVTTDDMFPSWSFNRIFITFNDPESTLTVTFHSIDHREQSSAIINNSNIYNKLMSYMDENDELVEYIAFDEEADTPIYLQATPVNMIRRSLAIENIDSSLLVDALFSNPTLVSHNIRESSFSDGQRALSIHQEGNSMEYYNPIESSTDRMDPIELLDRSIAQINDHKGWTEEYHLSSINQLKNNVIYRMHYDGYPVYNTSDLSTIEQEWQDHDLHFYRRLLFSLNDSLGKENMTLHGGTEVVNFLKHNSSFDTNRISDIKIGYKLTYLEDTSYSVVLEPAWYVNYDNRWFELKFEGTENLDKGGD